MRYNEDKSFMVDGGRNMKNILYVASEAVPFIKTGGLADVMASLTKYYDRKKYDER